MIYIKFIKNKYIPIIVLLFALINIKIDLEKKYSHYLFCQKCINNKIRNKSCLKCSINIIYKSIKVKTVDETLNEIITKKKSISRFGNGEFNIIFNKDIKFQKFNKRLKHKLLEVLNSSLKNLLIGIMRLEDVNNYSFWIKWFEKNKFRLLKLLDKNKIYYNSFITRFMTLFKNKFNNEKYISKFKTIWNNRDIIIIEGDKTRVGIGNDLFNNTKSIKRILCPNENAFLSFDKILKFFCSNDIDRNTLILISLGPTATVLAYELCKLGFQSIDIGHLDLQYEFYLKNVTHVIKIPNKYVNEISGGSLNISPVKDKRYYEEILMNIT